MSTPDGGYDPDKVLWTCRMCLYRLQLFVTSAPSADHAACRSCHRSGRTGCARRAQSHRPMRRSHGACVSSLAAAGRLSHSCS